MEDTNSKLTDNANRAIQGNVAAQVTRPGGQLWKQCKWRHLITKFWTNPSCATWWPNMQLMQVVPSGRQICNKCNWCHLVAKFATSASGAIWWPNVQLMQVVLFRFLLLKISTTTKSIWHGCVSLSDQTEQCSCYFTPIAKNFALNWNFLFLYFVCTFCALERW